MRRSFRWLGWFALGNLLALAVVVVAGRQTWIETAGEPRVLTSLVRLWLPLALAMFAAVSAVIVAVLEPRERDRFLLRHFALYAMVPLLLLLAFVSRPLLTGQAGALYMLMAFAFGVHALHGIWTGLDRLTDRRTALLAALALFVLALAIVPYHRTVQPTASDEPHYLLIMQSMVLDGDVELRNDYAGDRFLDFYPVPFEDAHAIEVGGAFYPIRDLGLPVIGAVPFALGGRTAVLALMALIGAVLAYQLFRLLRELGFGSRVTFLTVAAVGFTHPFLTYTSQVYPELLAALAFVVAARLLRHGAATTPLQLALASAAIGTLPWLTTRAWFVAVGVGLVIAFRAFRFDLPPGRSRVAATALRVIAGALPFGLLVLALCYANWRMFGLFLPSAGYYLIRDNQQVLVYTPHVGATGMLFDRVFGLIGRTPLYLLAFLGVAAVWRRARSGFSNALAPLFLGWLLSFLYIADIAYWWADGSPHSRYLLAGLPFLAVLVAGGVETIWQAAPRLRTVLGAGAWLAVAWSLFIVWAYAVQPMLGYDLAVDIRETGSLGALWEYFGRVVRPNPGILFPSLVRIDGMSVALSLVWYAIAIGLGVVGWRLARPLARGEAAEGVRGSGEPPAERRA